MISFCWFFNWRFESTTLIYIGEHIIYMVLADFPLCLGHYPRAQDVRSKHHLLINIGVAAGFFTDDMGFFALGRFFLDLIRRSIEDWCGARMVTVSSRVPSAINLVQFFYTIRILIWAYLLATLYLGSSKSFWFPFTTCCIGECFWSPWSTVFVTYMT